MNETLKVNPVYEKGERNYFCHFYNDCLTKAVKENKPPWHCLDCGHYDKKAPFPVTPKEHVDELKSPYNYNPGFFERFFL